MVQHKNLLIRFQTSASIRRKWPREMFGGDGINKTHESQQQAERWSEGKGRGAEKTLADFGGIFSFLISEYILSAFSFCFEREY